MNKSVVFFLIGFALVSSSIVRASGLKGELGLSAQGGMVIPLRHFADDSKFDAGTGFGVGGAAEYFVSNTVAVGGTFGYTVNGVRSEEDIPAGIDVEYRISSYGAFVKYLFPPQSNFMPYVRFDAGFYRPKLWVSSGDAKASFTFDSKFGFGGGVGLMLTTGDYALFDVEVLLHNAWTDGARAHPNGGEVELLYDIQYLTAYIGVTFLLAPH